MQTSFRSFLNLVEVSPIPAKKVLYARRKVKEGQTPPSGRAVVRAVFFN
ncbi:MAG: hypothetical protein QME69_04810 [Candidatus Saccharicenans sp.]|nr:hypothetical protein [Candidatus Saccharicenans sp.]